jgi:hypothetical protein
MPINQTRRRTDVAGDNGVVDISSARLKWAGGGYVRAATMPTSPSQNSTNPGANTTLDPKGVAQLTTDSNGRMITVYNDGSTAIGWAGYGLSAGGVVPVGGAVQSSFVIPSSNVLGATATNDNGQPVTPGAQSAGILSTFFNDVSTAVSGGGGSLWTWVGLAVLVWLLYELF